VCAKTVDAIATATMRETSADAPAPVAVEVVRGDTVESRHHAAVAVVDHRARLVAALGDPDWVTYTRSSLKPFQALPTVRHDVCGRFGLSSRHVAVMCGSHSGEECHLQAVGDILAATGHQVSDLQCGAHVPYWLRGTGEAVPPVSSFTALHNNCSGKHAGMLALASLLGAPHKDYLDPNSPVQRAIRQTIEDFCKVSPDQLARGTDGCSAPNYALPLRALALGYARLAHAAAAGGSSGPHDAAAATLIDAMRSHPELVSGTGRLDLRLAQATRGRAITKVGGEAVMGIVVPERALGIAIKITDGGERAMGPTAVAVLRQLGMLDAAADQQLQTIAEPQITNHRGIVVGSIRAVVALTVF